MAKAALSYTIASRGRYIPGPKESRGNAIGFPGAWILPLWMREPRIDGLQLGWMQRLDAVLSIECLQFVQQSRSYYLKHEHGKTGRPTNDDSAEMAKRELAISERWLKNLERQTQRAEKYTE